MKTNQYRNEFNFLKIAHSSSDIKSYTFPNTLFDTDLGKTAINPTAINTISPAVNTENHKNTQLNIH